MIVVNLFGGPGCGKSTGAAFITSVLKDKGYNVELVTEAAKDLLWDGSFKAMGCQMLVTGMQSYRVKRLVGKVDIVITDSPVLMGVTYNIKNGGSKELDDAIRAEFHSKELDNLNFFILRVKPYMPVGRRQSEDSAKSLDRDIKNLLAYESYTEVEGNMDGYNQIIEIVENHYAKTHKD